LQAATRILANDQPGRERLSRYILRPPLANDRLTLSDDGTVHLAFKRPWSDGTAAVTLEPLALIARLAALVPPPKRHTVRYFGVLSSHAASRSLVVPHPAEAHLAHAAAAAAKPARAKSKYIPWAELLRRTFAIDIKCSKCGMPLRLRALIKTETVIKKLLLAMHLPAEPPELHPARPPPGRERAASDPEDLLS